MAGKCFVFRFEDVEVRERDFQLIKAGKALTVEPKAVRTLLFLLHNPQKLISKEEILNAVWGDTAVTEGSLTRCIWLLRGALGDDIHSPHYIETVATVGYRFLCPVEEEAPGEPEATEQPTSVMDGKKERSRKRWWVWALAGGALAGGALALSIVFTIWYLRRPLPPLRVTSYTQLTHDGHRKSLAGTDGSRLFFTDIASDAAPGPIAEVAPSGGLIQQIAVPLPSPLLADVSPDGGNFLVISVSPGDYFQNPLWNVRVLGGSMRRLGDAADAAFSPDGNSVAFSKEKDEIWLVRSDGTGAHKLATVRGWLWGGWPWGITWSPDGNFIRFTRRDPIIGEAQLWEVSSGGSNLHQLLAGWHSTSWKCCGRWTSDGRFFLFLSDNQIWAFDEGGGLFRRQSGEPTQLAGGPIHWGRPIPSKDGTKIFAEGTLLRGELSRFDSKTRRFLPFLGGISAQEIVFSNDGKTVAYVTYPDGTLWKANRDGSRPVQLTDPPMWAFLPRWSPDGAEIAFTGGSPAIDNERGHVYFVPSEGGSPPKLLPEIRDFETSFPGWSPDGHKIVFNAGNYWTYGKVTHDVRILDLDSHQVTVVPGSADVWGPRWSPDGRYLAAGSEDERQLMVFDFKTQKWSALPQKGLVDSPEWSRDGEFIYFRRSRGDMGIFRISIKGGAPVKIADLADWHDAGASGKYMGLDPTDAPLLLRDIGSDEIYALTLEQQ
jgi:Tol biopolymer transport system component/DNA-binding winged helix-turn-helix (wHTH) protein